MRRTTYLAALAVFAISGISGLIYQSIWAQYLGLFLGHAAYAQSLVLAIFMGGMAIGAWRASVWTGRLRNLLRAYALVELCIGVAAAIFHPVFGAFTHFAYDTAFPALASSGLAEPFKWLSAALLILPQAILLGATFPLMSNGLMRRLPNEDGAVLSGLYFVNSIGAAAGALIATFVLVPAVGLPGAMRFGAVLNIAVALIAFLLSAGQDTANAAPRERASGATVASPLAFLAGAAAITGATSFVYEIGWVRMLSLAFGSTTHAFELMLAAFIGGLALGGLWIRGRIDGYERPARVAGYAQVLMGLAALTSLVLYDHSFDWVAWFMHALARTDAGYDLFNFATASVAILIMAPTAFFAGMTLPLFTLALLRGNGGEESVGRIYAANTLGAIVGIFAAVHLMLPHLGLKLSMIAAAAGDLALGIVLLRRTLDEAQVRRYLATLVVCGIGVSLALLFARFDPMAMTGGVYRTGKARLTNADRILFYRDGKTASVASYRRANGLAAIATNGKPDASIQVDPERPPSPDEITMIMAALLPLATHPDPHTAAVIGFGSGLSTHTLLGDARLQSVDTIEIEPAMYEGAKVFGKAVDRAYNDRRSHIIFDDAKAYFATSQRRYDILIAEPSNPWVSGISNLFSREFYHFLPRHLKPGGIYVQWIQQYEIDDELVATAVNAFAETFADFRIYLTDNADMLIIASVDTPLGALQDSVFREPGLAEQLKRMHFASPADLVMHQVGDRHSLLPMYRALSSRVNSDYYPILSLEAPRARFVGRIAKLLQDVTIADLPVREVLAGIPPPDPALVSGSQDFPQTLMAHTALEVANAFAQQDMQSSSALANAIAFTRSSVGRCENEGNGSFAVDNLVSLAGATIPLLDAQHLQGLWSKPRWISCSSHPAPVSELLVLLDVLSRRDFKDARLHATKMLENYRSVLTPFAQDWLLRATILCAIAEHEYADVPAIIASLGKDIAPAPNTELQRAYLVAFARAQLDAAEPAGKPPAANPAPAIHP